MNPSLFCKRFSLFSVIIIKVAVLIKYGISNALDCSKDDALFNTNEFRQISEL